MIEINNNYIITDVYDIMIELRKQLDANGIKRFSKIIKSGNNIQTNCPFHHDGQERKPSFGILTKSTNDYKAGQCHCFACGWSGTLSEMISNCFGYDDFGKFGNKWLVSNFLTVGVENRPDIEFDIGRNASHTKKEIKFISENELDKYRYYHPYMWKRKLSPGIVDLFDVGYDNETECITFPVRDVNGNCLFIARRSVNVKYFNYPQNVDKPVYGLYELSQLEKYPNEVVICESIINALTCWVWGKYAVALNGTGTKFQYKQLREMPNRKFILALDPDNAGNAGREKLKKALYNKIVTDYIIPEGKDINDLTEKEFKNLQECY